MRLSNHPVDLIPRALCFGSVASRTRETIIDAVRQGCLILDLRVITSIIPSVVPAECMEYFRPDFSVKRWTSAIWEDTDGEDVPIWGGSVTYNRQTDRTYRDQTEIGGTVGGSGNIRGRHGGVELVVVEGGESELNWLRFLLFSFFFLSSSSVKLINSLLNFYFYLFIFFSSFYP